MAEQIGFIRKNGGKKYTETVLWTNPSPTADFANQTVTLSESINNYKYIKFTWKRAKADSLEGNLLVPSDVLNKCRDAQNDLAFHLGASNTTPQTFGRIIQKVSDTSVVFGSCFRTTTNTRANDMCIPLEIIGVNELAHNGTVRSAFCINGTSAGTTYGHACATSDTTLMDIDSGGTNTQAKSYTVKRDAKGKVGFTFSNRGTVTRYPTVTLNGTNIYSGRLDDWILNPMPLIDVTLSANDVIELSCGQSTSQLIAMYFIEE